MNNNTQRTRKDWFQRLPQELCDKAVFNTLSQNGVDTLNRRCDDFDEAINGGFCWSDTIEGHEYWSNISDYKEESYSFLPFFNRKVKIKTLQELLKMKKSKTKFSKKFHKKLDWKFGMEPTFMIDPKYIPKSYFLEMDEEDEEPLWSRFIDKTNSNFSQNIAGKLQHKWAKLLEFDNEQSNEVPTPTYVDFQMFKKDYEEFVKELDYYGFVPSSRTSLFIEGGNHQNFDFEWIIKTYGSIVAQKFLRNLIYYVNKHPYIVWYFLSPEDNESSVLLNTFEFSRYGKGDWLNPRGRRNVSTLSTNVKEVPDFFIKYLELRFFMMPRTTEEMVLHYEFAIELLNFILKMSIEIQEYPLIIQQVELSNFTFKQCEEGMKQVCEDLQFDYNRLVKFGKHKMMKKRISNGLDYMK